MLYAFPPHRIYVIFKTQFLFPKLNRLRSFCLAISGTVNSLFIAEFKELYCIDFKNSNFISSFVSTIN